MKTYLSAERVRHLLSYDAETGVFRWRVREHSGGRVSVGDVAGAVRRDGYVTIGVDGQRHLAHRIAWLHSYGQQPAGEIDHIDGNPSNNRIANLRDVSHAANQQNQRRAHRGSSIGVMGVRKSSSGKFIAEVTVGGRTTYVGSYQSHAEAHEAYKAAKRTAHSGCTI